MNALFETQTSLSPHSAWFMRHDLRIRDYQDRRNGGWERHSLNSARFLCSNAAMTRYASGDTQDAAEQAYCEQYDLPWWKLAEWNGAMGSFVGMDTALEPDESITMLVEAKRYGDVGVVALPASMEL